MDCSDPHPEVTRQTHSLEELQIIPGSDREKLNPRFIQHPKSCYRSPKSCKLSLPDTFERETTDTSASNQQRKSTSTRSSDSRESVRAIGGDNTSQRSQKRESTEMEILVQVPAALQNRDNDDADVVKMKPTQMQLKKHTATSNKVMQDTRDSQDLRDSVSSSESVGVNPEYGSMDLDMDAFAVDLEQGHRCWKEDGSTATSGDKIVGFEVSTDTSETTVNLLHLFGRKNKTVEQTKIDYQDQGLWVIGEEEESEDEMEEEIYLSDGASGGDPETIPLSPQLPVPQLFIVDENNTIVEKVKTGRRRQSSRGSVSDSHLPPPVSSPEQLNLHTLTLDDRS